MPIPSMSLQTSSSSEAKGASNSGFDNSGFNVNFGGAGGVTTGALPSWVWIAVAAGAAWWLIKRR